MNDFFYSISRAKPGECATSSEYILLIINREIYYQHSQLSPEEIPIFLNYGRFHHTQTNKVYWYNTIYL